MAEATQDTIPSLSDKDYNQIIGSIQRGEPIDWLDAEFAKIIGKRAYTSGDTATFKLLKGEFPSLEAPSQQVSSPEQIVLDALTKGKKGVPVGSKELPAHLVSLKNYSDDYIQNIADYSGTGPIEGLPFMEDYTIETDWWKEAMSHVEISPHSRHYEKFKDKKLKISDHDKRLLGFARGKGEEEVTEFIRAKGKSVPVGAIRVTASNGVKGVTEQIDFDDLVINQEKFFRQFSGLGAPTKKGEVKISPRSSSLAHTLLLGGTTHPLEEPRGNKFVALEKEDCSLYWSRAPSTTIQGR